MAKTRIELKSDIPETVMELLAYTLLDSIVDYFSSEEGQKEFQEWKSKQTNAKNE